MEEEPTEEPTEQIDNELRTIRKEAKIKMSILAKAAGTSYRTWQNWEDPRYRTPQIAIEWLKLWLERRGNANG